MVGRVTLEFGNCYTSYNHSIVFTLCANLNLILKWKEICLDDAESKKKPDVVLEHNKSGRFECRWSTVRVEPSPAIHLRNMVGSVLGVWVAHGEGMYVFPYFLI